MSTSLSGFGEAGAGGFGGFGGFDGFDEAAGGAGGSFLTTAIVNQPPGGLRCAVAGLPGRCAVSVGLRDVGAVVGSATHPYRPGLRPDGLLPGSNPVR